VDTGLKKDTELNSNTIAVLCVLFGSLCFTAVFASGKYLEVGDLAMQIMFFRYLSGFVCVLIIHLSFLRHHTNLKTTQLRFHFGRALCGGLGGGAAIFAASKMALTDATAIGMLHVVVAILIGMLIFREKIGLRRAIGILLCVVGAYGMIFGKDSFWSGSAQPLVPIIIAFCGAFLVGLEGILIKFLAHRDGPFVLLFWVNLLGVLIFLPFALWDWTLSSHVQKLSFLMLGPIALVGQYFNILGYRLADISIVSPIDYSWLVFSGLAGFFVFGETINWFEAAAIIIIVFGGYWLSTEPSTPEQK
jgi:drug/metabolite transporter (DMT)-like permease